VLNAGVAQVSAADAPDPRVLATGDLNIHVGRADPALIRQMAVLTTSFALTSRTTTRQRTGRPGLSARAGFSNTARILAVPVGACGVVASIMSKHLKAGAVITDVGSVKGAVAKDVAPELPDSVSFVPSHPIAGAERSGPDAGRGDLFVNRWWILTPLEASSLDAVDKLGRFFASLGADLEIMDTEHHDLVLAITSHVPHLIAYNIVGTAADLETVTKSEVIKFSAGGFRDFTRIAASDPTMWRDVFLNNREAVLEMLGRFSEDLSSLQRAIRWGDGETLHALFTRTRSIRREIIEAGQEVDTPDFGREQASGGVHNGGGHSGGGARAAEDERIAAEPTADRPGKTDEASS